MFSSLEQLKKRNKGDKYERLNYLQSLADEYKSPTISLDYKRQVLANLANFAYDPVNYEFLRRTKCLNIFIDALSECDSKLIEFGASGLCNSSLCKINKRLIVENGLNSLKICLRNTNEETVCSVMTTLTFLYAPEYIEKIKTPEVVELIKEYRKSTNVRLKNLASILLDDYFRC